MTPVVFVVLTLVAVAGTAVVLTTRPKAQAAVLSVFGLLLGLLFLVLQAPDVAMSQVAVGSAVVPLMVLLAERTVRRDR